MYVCSCKAVNDTVVRAAVAAGAASLEELAVRCGAGSGCGGCRPVLARLLAEVASKSADIAA